MFNIIYNAATNASSKNGSSSYICMLKIIDIWTVQTPILISINSFFLFKFLFKRRKRKDNNNSEDLIKILLYDTKNSENNA